jgi:hypothetical protein
MKVSCKSGLSICRVATVKGKGHAEIPYSTMSKWIRSLVFNYQITIPPLPRCLKKSVPRVTQQQYNVLCMPEPSHLWIAQKKQNTAVINEGVYGLDEL